MKTERTKRCYEQPQIKVIDIDLNSSILTTSDSDGSTGESIYSVDVEW